MASPRQYVLTLFLSSVAFLLLVLLFPNESYAAPRCNCRIDADCRSGEVCGWDVPCESTVYTGLCQVDTPGCVETPIGCIPTDTGELTRWVVGKVVTIAGLIAVLLFIIGGYGIATAGGDPDRITEGKAVIAAAIGGLLFILLSTLLLHIIGIDILGLENWLY